jgi:hypothetical protein
MAAKGNVNLKPINRERIVITIEGTTVLIHHKWAEKALREIREKKGGKKTRERSICNPEQEGQDAAYMTADGRFGVPLLAIKSAIISAAHKDIGIEKTLVRKALFIRSEDPSMVLPMRCETPTIREDFVRVGQGGTDLRYRPEFAAGWEVDLDIEYDAEFLNPNDIVNLIERAGFGVGICEWRPEKGGEFGRFRVKVAA